jgi:transketolase
MEAASILEGRGVFCRVYSVHTIKPFDHEELAVAVAETGGLLTIEEHTLEGGLGSAVAESCMDRGLRPKAFARMGLPSAFCPVVGSQEYLRRRYDIDATSIASTVTRLLGGRNACD